ncbi:hypothetical protein [Sinomonas sp. G460-2]|uniref:biotin synthase auxiliary protein BsaP n=1 Tax=Sinomonas sp. G460-2 TaxID=3393464 RepID=UPI0039F0AECB
MKEVARAGELFCGHCGQPSVRQPAEAGGSTPSSAALPSNAHERCCQRLSLEPPRYCAACGRRMKVQVAPLGWRAECSRHGSLTS